MILASGYLVLTAVMGIQMQICSILRFSWSILAKCCAHLRTNSSKTQILLLGRLYFSNIDCFVRDSSPLHLTFVAFCLLSIIRKQYLKQYNYSVDQSALLTGFRTRCDPDVPPRETSPLAKSEQKRLFSQANHHIVENCSSLIRVNKHYELIQFAF